ncbi:hypothetical protein Goshw_006595 [Gossypium schwendimanii]|uniref:Uncharacterized protein n=1 Tax=Gossypium schwendimanii TaxID=34291 RepID=A0A7J9MWR9_GOSSC|nr:hypothetical protein [Gossypium schwendimanii]
MVKVVLNDLNRLPDHARSFFEEDAHGAMAMELSLDSFWSLDVKANNSEGLTAGEIIAKAMIRERNELSENMINATPVVTTLVITAIYQSCLSPPAGVRQDEGDHSISISNTTLPLDVNKHDESFLGLGSR